MNEIKITSEDKEIILNQIDRINIISDLKNNSITNKILYNFLVYSINHYDISLSERHIINNIYNDCLTVEERKAIIFEKLENEILDSLKLLSFKNVLLVNIENAIKYYSLNYKYFNENDI